MDGILVRNFRRALAIAFTGLLAAVICFESGCAAAKTQMPRNLTELQSYFAQTPDKYTIEEINQVSLSRVLNDQLTEAERYNSLLVLIQLNGCTTRALNDMTLVLDNPNTPKALKRSIVGVLASNDQGGIEKYVLEELSADADPRLTNSLLDWITRHPAPQMLDEIVMLWSQSSPDNQQVENRFRRAVETIALRTWPEAMLEAINDNDFKAKTSALKILYLRISPQKLTERINNTVPRGTAMQALRYYATEMNTLPQPDNFYNSVVAFVSERDSLGKISATVKFWSEQDGYIFTPADIHLLEYVASRWGSNVYARDAVTNSIITDISSRKSDVDTEQLAKNIARMDTADIYRLQLLCELFSNPETSRKLRLVAQRDAADTTSRWGGLVSGYDGGVGATLYPPAAKVSDYDYNPSDRFLHDAANSLCWFVCHFEPNGRSIDRPEGGELKLAQIIDLPGVIISSVGQDHYSVVFFASEKLVIPLGVFQFTM